jgi:lipopolysaccharide exporter
VCDGLLVDPRRARSITTRRAGLPPRTDAPGRYAVDDLTGDDRENGFAALREATVSGARWIGLSRIVVEGAALAVSVVLARLIPPAAFGHAAVALVVFALAATIGPSGLTAPLVQRSAIDREQIGVATTLSLVAGVAFTGLTLLFAVTVGPAIFGEDVAVLLALASPVWIVGAAAAVPQAMLQRELSFKSISLIDSAAVIVGATSALVLAITGMDAGA